MAEEVVLTAAGWVASPLVKMVIEKALGYLDTGLEESSKKLAVTVIPRLSLAIEKAEESPNKGKLEAWLKRLKDAYYEAQEVIDQFHYEELKRKVKDGRRVKNKRGTPISLLSKFSWSKLKPSGILSRQQANLKGCIDKLIEIAIEAHEFRDLLEELPNNVNSRDPISHRETHSQPLGRVFGREKDIENVAALLNKKPSDSEPGPSTRPPIPFIAITGRSGIGKTALAKEVYNYMEKQKHFDHSVWVHVPRRFKVTEVIKDMINIIQPKGDHNVCNHDPSVTLSVLEEQIKQMTSSKKILLVLDDFWCDSEDFRDQWENFISCLGNWLPESRILLTSQSINAATEANVNDLTKGKPYNLQELEESKFLELFMHHAWPSDSSDLEREKFEEIGREIVVKLKGDPGAAKQVGRELKGKRDLQYWEKISEKDWLGDNMKARIWSYQQLPAHLQRCFSFCGLFPKGTKLHPQFLVHLWMAEGLIQLKDDEQRMEDAAENYLHELVSRFFLEEHIDEENKDTYYQLHDLLHDLAERVQGDDFIRIEWTNSSEVFSPIGENIRHVNLYLSVECVGMINELKDVIFSMKKICTLVLCVESPSIIPKEVLQEILKNSKKLRVLQILGYGNDLPENVGDLKHLRYLGVTGSSPLKKLPDSICKLYHLQVLFLPNCESIPKNFSQLISLRHFNDVEIMPRISNVGRLTSLQYLSQFVVSAKPGHELHQLENLNQLREKLCISGLENVENIGEAAMAKMKGKKDLKVLELEWNSDKRGSDDFQLLDALQPHPNISALRISGYRGNKFPNWLLGHNSLRHLKSLTLEECNEVEEIPSIHESLPNCRTLNLCHLEYLKELPVLPPNLTKLVINDIPQLSYFSEDDLLMKDEIKQSALEVVNQIAERFKSMDIVQLDGNVNFTIMRFIGFVWYASGGKLEGVSEDTLLELFGVEPWSDENSRDQILNLWVRCADHHFKTMFNKTEESKLVLPCSLTSLEIRRCSITRDALSTCMQLLDSLSELTLCEIQTVASLPTKKVLCALNNLRSLTIDRCFLLNSLGGIVALTSLTELRLWYCINLNVSYEPLPSSLETLDLFYSITKVDVGPLSRLKKLAIVPRGDFALKGLNSLTQLSELVVWADSTEIHISSPMDKCSSQLQRVRIDNPLLLTQMLSDETISSLQNLSIEQVKRDSLDDEVFRSLISLDILAFRDCNIKCLPLSLKDLASLHFMFLENCPNLCELEDLPLPENLTTLLFEGCPVLTEKFIKDGRYRVQLEEGKTIFRFPSKGERKRF